ncbi:uncharacterized protein V1518DRAFT_423805 [Limtongia smithiae]|uniref:uncharacterized protein n=1 Tax=Limtongia smithiae TaxID=1125753 RepID=UPI0034CF1B74
MIQSPRLLLPTHRPSSRAAGIFTVASWRRGRPSRGVSRKIRYFEPIPGPPGSAAKFAAGNNSSQYWNHDEKFFLEVFVSRSRSPYFNLAFEDYLFSTFPTATQSEEKLAVAQALDQPKIDDALAHRPKTLFLYANTPCVVIGRNQNPYREVNLQELRAAGVPLLRRKSGGGTVYHDLGNVNYSVMTQSADFTRAEHARTICDAVNRHLIWTKKTVWPLTERMQLAVNERYDIVNNVGSKVSGSAYKIERGKAYHHGTFLLQADLARVSKLLHRPLPTEGGPGERIRGGGVESVRSPVANIEITSSEFVDAVIERFGQLYSYKQNNLLVTYVDEQELTTEQAAGIAEREATLKSWEWTYASTPKFRHNFQGLNGSDAIEFMVKEGHITRVVVKDMPALLPSTDTAVQELVGQPYIADTIVPKMPDTYWQDRIRAAL